MTKSPDPHQVAESQLLAVKEEYESAKADISKFEGERAELNSKVRTFLFKYDFDGCSFNAVFKYLKKPSQTDVTSSHTHVTSSQTTVTSSHTHVTSSLFRLLSWKKP